MAKRSTKMGEKRSTQKSAPPKENPGYVPAFFSRSEGRPILYSHKKVRTQKSWKCEAG